ncbi:MAG: glycosyltransferase family 4 protein [Gemmatimonadaceae bacterium]
MKHLFITQDFGPDLGGMARRHVELCRRLADDGMVVSTVAARDAAAFDAGERYEIDRQPFTFERAKLLSNELRWARWLQRRCRAGGVDIVHCGNIRPTGYAAWWTFRRGRKPYLLYVNGADLLREREKAHNALKRATARAIFGKASAIVANSAWTAEIASATMHEVGLRAQPLIATIELGTDPAAFGPDRDSGALRHRFALGDSPLLCTVARLVPHKGHDMVLRALALIAGELPSLRYLVVGTGPHENDIRRLAADLGIGDRVVLAGALSDAEIAEAYATSTVYVGLSRIQRRPGGSEQGGAVEGFGISFVEAGASGLPCVAGDSGGVRSAVRDGETGLVVPPCDPEAIAAAIRALIEDPERRRRMGAAARLAVEMHYNWDRVARDTSELARSVLTEFPHRAPPESSIP